MHDFKAFFNNKLFSNRLKKTDNYVQQNWMMKSKQVERGIHKEQRGRNNSTHGQTDLTDAYLSCKRWNEWICRNNQISELPLEDSAPRTQAWNQYQLSV